MDLRNVFDNKKGGDGVGVYSMLPSRLAREGGWVRRG